MMNIYRNVQLMTDEVPKVLGTKARRLNFNNLIFKLYLFTVQLLFVILCVNSIFHTLHTKYIIKINKRDSSIKSLIM